MKKLIRTIVLNLIWYIQIESVSAVTPKPIPISLGSDCWTALKLRYFKIRDFALPFDWITSRTFSKVCLLLANNFQNFLSNEYLTYKGTYIHNFVYDINFVHDFPIKKGMHYSHSRGIAQAASFLKTGIVVDNWESFSEQVKKKYKPRIERLYNILNGIGQFSGKPVVFIRNIYTSPAEAQIFVQLIKHKFPNLKFTLAVIHDLPELNYNWNIENVKQFCLRPLDPNNPYERWSDNEWYMVFQDLNLL